MPESKFIFRIYRNATVLEAARARISWLFDEFKTVICTSSGGKDSTVIYHLTLEEARRRGRRLPLLFIDQEVEWESTIDIVRWQMEQEGVDPYWIQCPFKMLNATSKTERQLNCWNPAQEAIWMREKEPCSFKENIYGDDEFTLMFDAVCKYHFKGRFTLVGGMRCEESPARTLTLTSRPIWKWATWGKEYVDGQGRFVFHPIYDWSVSDVWKAIHEQGWRYNPIYDLQYQHGYSIRDMRVSSLCHATAVQNIFTMQEFEPATYSKMCARLAGTDMAAKMGHEDYFPKELPIMFVSWRDYRDYLLEKLIAEEKKKITLRKVFASQDKKYQGEFGDKLYKLHVRVILTNGNLTKLVNFDSSRKAREIKKYNQDKELEEAM